MVVNEKIVENATCTFCGCVCDDITLTVDTEKKVITSEFKSKDKYYYYTHLFDEYNNLIEIFEIVDPEKNSSFRELEIKEEEQQ